MSAVKSSLVTLYSRMIDDYAWYRKGDVFEIAKLAKRLKRSYMDDIVARKMALRPSNPKV